MHIIALIPHNSVAADVLAAQEAGAGTSSYSHDYPSIFQVQPLNDQLIDTRTLSLFGSNQSRLQIKQ